MGWDVGQCSLLGHHLSGETSIAPERTDGPKFTDNKKRTKKVNMKYTARISFDKMNLKLPEGEKLKPKMLNSHREKIQKQNIHLCLVLCYFNVYIFFWKILWHMKSILRQIHVVQSTRYSLKNSSIEALIKSNILNYGISDFSYLVIHAQSFSTCLRASQCA